jgi:hypothetical protein
MASTWETISLYISIIPGDLPPVVRQVQLLPVEPLPEAINRKYIVSFHPCRDLCMFDHGEVLNI